MMDEVGSALQHSDIPNVEIHPFIYCKDLVAMNNPENHAVVDPSQRITYSLLWPKKKIEKDEILVRDFLPKITEDEFRSARLCVWYITPEKYYQEAIAAFRDQSKAIEDKKEEYEKTFEENQQKDDSFLNKLKDLGRPIKLFPYYVSIPGY